MVQVPDWNFPAALPPVQYALGHQHLGIRRMEVRTLPQVLSPAAFHLERAALHPAYDDHASIAARRYSLPLRLMPVQFRQLQKV